MLKEKADCDADGDAGHRTGGASAAVCAGCGCRIYDRYYLLAVDRQWHGGCLRCCECKLLLNTELTCFARHGNIYCKDDYYRIFGVSRCGRCRAGISANELVMRARDCVYHVHCFTCATCDVPLAKGDQFGLREGLVYCRPHYHLLYMDTGGPCSTPPLINSYYMLSTATSCHHAPSTPSAKGRPRSKRHNKSMSNTSGSESPIGNDLIHHSELSSSIDSLSYDSSVASPGSGSCSGSGHHQAQRTKRMRTSFKHHQLRTMKSYFAINQNPDAKDLKQLAQKTGLSKRVLQVWFQNARAKWRRNLMRQEAGVPSNCSPGAGHLTPASEQPPAPLAQQQRHGEQQLLTFVDIY